MNSRIRVIKELTELVRFIGSAAASDNLLPLEIDLSECKIGNAGAEIVAQAISSGINAQKINLRLNEIGNDGMIALAKAFSSERCPEDLQIDLEENDISNQGATFLGNLLSSGQCHSGLKINLRSNHIGNEGGAALAKAFEMGKLPGRVFDFANNRLGNQAAVAFVEAIKNREYQGGVQFNFSDNYIGNEGVIAFAEAIEGGTHFQNSYINLSYNRIGESGAEAFTGALRSDNYPQNLLIDATPWQECASASVRGEFAYALSDRKKMVMRPFVSTYVALLQGYRQNHPLISKLPLAILNSVIIPFIFPFPEQKKKMQGYVDNISKRVPLRDVVMASASCFFKRKASSLDQNADTKHQRTLYQSR